MKNDKINNKDITDAYINISKISRKNKIAASMEYQTLIDWYIKSIKAKNYKLAEIVDLANKIIKIGELIK